MVFLCVYFVLIGLPVYLPYICSSEIDSLLLSASYSLYFFIPSISAFYYLHIVLSFSLNKKKTIKKKYLAIRSEGTRFISYLVLFICLLFIVSNLARNIRNILYTYLKSNNKYIDCLRCSCLNTLVAFRFIF